MKLFKMISIISVYLVIFVILSLVIGGIIFGLVYLFTEFLGVIKGLTLFSFGLAGTGISSLLVAPKIVYQLEKYEEEKKKQGYLR